MNKRKKKLLEIVSKEVSSFTPSLKKKQQFNYSLAFGSVQTDQLTLEQEITKNSHAVQNDLSLPWANTIFYINRFLFRNWGKLSSLFLKGFSLSDLHKRNKNCIFVLSNLGNRMVPYLKWISIAASLVEDWWRQDLA